MSLTSQVFEERRRRLMAGIGPGAAAIFAAAPESVRSNDVEYRYRQHSDFHYLTGFPEPGAVCLLLPGHPKEEYVLFVRPRDPERETWTGRRAGVEGSIASFGAQMAYSIEEIEQKLPPYLADREQLYFGLDRNTREFRSRVLGWLEQAQANRPRTGTGPKSLIDPREILHEMRLRKDPEELACMRRAAAITAEAHAAVMREARPGLYEYEIEALIEYTFRRMGAGGPAYLSVVASGANATILHYTANDALLRDGDLLLVDAGAEVEYYCADVTRTLPVGLRFEGRGRALYEIVLEAQRVAIETIEPGASVDAVHARAVSVLIDGLIELGLIAGSRSEIQERELYKPFYMHRTSHWLGMDVHDAGQYKVKGESRALEAGMVLTVEPGLYLGDQIENLAPEWRGLGVRIEDDVLVTTEGHDVLTAGIPKRIDEIEARREKARPRSA
jgi:Xaa-Pro aminopeptidase